VLSERHLTYINPSTSASLPFANIEKEMWLSD